MTPEEVGKLGNAIYEEKIRHLIEPVEHGVMVRIDVNSGEWEVADGSPGDKLRERPHFQYVGQPAAADSGGGIQRRNNAGSG